MLERAPGLMWPVVSNPLIVEFTEVIVGPFVQLDNLTLAAFPPMNNTEAGDKVSVGIEIGGGICRLVSTNDRLQRTRSAICRTLMKRVGRYVSSPTPILNQSRYRKGSGSLAEMMRLSST